MSASRQEGGYDDIPFGMRFSKLISGKARAIEKDA